MVQDATAKIEQLLDSKVKIEGKALDFFLSTEITGNGSSQSTAHGLVNADFVGRTPVLVLVIPSNSDATTNYVWTPGTHTSTNVLVTATTNAKYRVLAI